MISLLQSLPTFALTVLAGGAIANHWQRKRSAESRLFDASNETYKNMIAVSDRLVSLIGDRIYSSQRVCLLNRDNDAWDNAVSDYKSSVLNWNKALIGFELQLKTIFRTVRMSELESLQSRLRVVNLTVESIVRGAELTRENRVEVHAKLAELRHSYFEFAQRMISEARLLFREMHFGVKQSYESWDLDSVPTWQLFKLLFEPRSYNLGIIRSPADLGKPVNAREARFGVDQ